MDVPASTTDTEAPAPTTGMWTQPAALAQWLARHTDCVTPPVAVDRVGIGQSNITTIVTDAAAREWVMREPPPGDTATKAHDVLREAHILSALANTDVPVPRVIGTGESPTGSPFLVMDRVPGSPLESEDDARTLTASQRRALGVSVAEALGRLHRIDPSALGVAASSSPYLVRQMRRISAAWDHVRAVSRHDGNWEAVRAGLTQQLPQPSPAVVMHGDYRLSNLLIADGHITAVLDWELCTIGDPFADLAWLLDDWRPSEEPAIVMPTPTRAGGFPNRDEMVEVYRAVTGFRIDDLDYYRAFSQWRAASLLEGVRARRRAGSMGSHAAIDLDELEDSIGVLLASASSHLARMK
ncbi:MAG: phosphotransferase family protein [Actinobacteria bacterium]|nr:phosphotransferase family protein [Actinomycetota bacterium]